MLKERMRYLEKMDSCNQRKKIYFENMDFLSRSCLNSGIIFIILTISPLMINSFFNFVSVDEIISIMNGCLIFLFFISILISALIDKILKRPIGIMFLKQIGYDFEINKEISLAKKESVPVSSLNVDLYYKDLCELYNNGEIESVDKKLLDEILYYKREKENISSYERIHNLNKNNLINSIENN